MSSVRFRKPNSPYIKSVRSMTREDLQFLREKSARPVIQKLRESHHIIARLAASGMTTREIAAEVGYTETRVGLLRNTPAMKELIARYMDMDTDEWRKSRDTNWDAMQSLMRRTVRKANDAFEDDEDKNEIPLHVTLKYMDSMLDRLGYHRKSTKENINMDFAASLERAIAERAKVIEGKVLDE